MNWSVLKDPTIVITAAVYGLLQYIAMRAGMFGIWLGILLLISLGRYCYAVLRATAQGRQYLPAVSIESFNPVGEVMVLWHLILFPGMILATAGWQPAGTVVAVFAACIFPASAALMGLTSNIAHSLRPSALLGVARTIGNDYVVLVFGYVGIFVGVGVLQNQIVPQLSFLAAIISLMLETWALLASFALIGSAVRAHRQEFEIPGEIVPREELALQQRHAQWSQTLDRAYASMRSGLVPEGYATLRQLIDSHDDRLEVTHWIFENLFEWEEKHFALTVARKLIGQLIEHGDVAAALELWRRCRRHDAGFAVDPADAGSLADCAASLGQAGLADEIRMAN